MKKTTLIDIVSFLLIVLFVYTASSKIRDFRTFNFQMHYYPWIKQFGGILSIGIPAVELALSALLLLPKTKVIGMWSSIVLLCIFTIYLILMVSFEGKNLPCSCGGVISKLSWKQHIVFNLFFITVTWVSLRIRGRYLAGPGAEKPSIV